MPERIELNTVQRHQQHGGWRISVAPMMDRCENIRVARVPEGSCALGVQFPKISSGTSSATVSQSALGAG
ncbi:hypothetical protein EZ313_19285 [Ramlibacter henchirensis]|uniref:Uncharacterized protein n=1 Tax=Ramlibacter henchirensis TaxID=204072 RepID=A0A4Z0BQC9_9BURK|nr:hypothetical protein [Ramlibacter henchirensis]TFZ00600.1 hypothetical protein EZ313_19285 [Ramlibacter henchirensis]